MPCGSWWHSKARPMTSLWQLIPHTAFAHVCTVSKRQVIMQLPRIVIVRYLAHSHLPWA